MRVVENESQKGGKAINLSSPHPPPPPTPHRARAVSRFYADVKLPVEDCKGSGRRGGGGGGRRGRIIDVINY